MKPSDQQILCALLVRPSGIMTYVIRNILETEHGFRGLRTATILRSLKRLEVEGKVRRVPSPYMVQLCWAITDAGRLAARGEG